MKPRSPKISFYGSCAGVGRTTTLLHVGKLLARQRTVLVVDMNLDEPFHGLSFYDKRPTGSPGMTDYVFARLKDPSCRDLTVTDCVHPISEACFLMPVGTRPFALDRRLPGIYEHDDECLIFQLLIAELEDTFEPCFILFNSAPGSTHSAGLCTLELCDTLVVFSGISERQIHATKAALETRLNHEAWRHQRILLALGPVPDEALRPHKEQERNLIAYEEYAHLYEPEYHLHNPSPQTAMYSAQVQICGLIQECEGYVPSTFCIPYDADIVGDGYPHDALTAYQGLADALAALA